MDKPKALHDLRVKLYADGADRAGIEKLMKVPWIHGITTNPTLMRKSGIADYESFAREILELVGSKPISFEVFSDEFAEMKQQALKIASWKPSVYVKIPITNTRGESSLPLIQELAKEGVKLNVTAVLEVAQVGGVVQALDSKVEAIVSVFAGRIADTGRNPVPLMKKCLALLQKQPKAELLWASVREVRNIYEAEECGCHIVTVPHAILQKAQKMSGHDLKKLSLNTVQQFYQDGREAGYKL